MRQWKNGLLPALVGSLWVAIIAPTRAAEESPSAAPPWQAADQCINEAIARGQLPGAVLCVGDSKQILYLKAYGQRAVQPEKVAMTDDTIFDLASLTKPIATSTAVMMLVERKKIALSDPVAKYLPALGNHGKQAVTIEQLLLHRGGLIADNPLSDFDAGGKAGLEAIFRLPLKSPPGERFVYSDVGFIILGELVHQVDGRTLDRFTREEIFEPLGMKTAGYLPPNALKARIAPTQKRGDHWMQGEVHDPRAFALGGVAGHAGLFGSANDLARFCQMLLQHGELDGRRILTAATVKTWTTVRYSPDKAVGRTYGFDADTDYSSPRGPMTKGLSFGHTGFTGTSLWIDPQSDRFVILLASAVHPDGKGKVIGLRRDVANSVGKERSGVRGQGAEVRGQ